VIQHLGRREMVNGTFIRYYRRTCQGYCVASPHSRGPQTCVGSWAARVLTLSHSRERPAGSRSALRRARCRRRQTRPPVQRNHNLALPRTAPLACGHRAFRRGAQLRSAMLAISLAKQLGQPRDVDGDESRLVLCISVFACRFGLFGLQPSRTPLSPSSDSERLP
jgi:hypothetical protein